MHLTNNLTYITFVWNLSYNMTKQNGCSLWLKFVCCFLTGADGWVFKEDRHHGVVDVCYQHAGVLFSCHHPNTSTTLIFSTGRNLNFSCNLFYTSKSIFINWPKCVGKHLWILGILHIELLHHITIRFP